MTYRLPGLPARPTEAHKGHFGRVQIIGGSAGMAGAPALAALAALRTGAGLVQVVCPPEIRSTVMAITPCAITALPRDSDCREFDPTVRAVGPGCRDTLTADQLKQALQDSSVPLVVDADGLNLLAGLAQWWTLTAAHVVLTPHPGEMKRLLANTTIDAGQARATLAEQVASLCRAVVVLKGHGTVVSAGSTSYLNETGNPGMATGGSGDVLTGAIAALLGQGLGPFDAACAGVYLHGLAGDLAAQKLGQVSVTAADIIDFLPAAILSYRSA